MAGAREGGFGLAGGEVEACRARAHRPGRPRADGGLRSGGVPDRNGEAAVSLVSRLVGGRAGDHGITQREDVSRSRRAVYDWGRIDGVLSADLVGGHGTGGTGSLDHYGVARNLKRRRGDVDGPAAAGRGGVGGAGGGGGLP